MALHHTIELCAVRMSAPAASNSPECPASLTRAGPFAISLHDLRSRPFSAPISSLCSREWVAETVRGVGLWVKGHAEGALVGAVSNERHSVFSALRNECAMNLRRPRMPVQVSDAANADAARIETIWRDCREKYVK